MRLLVKLVSETRAWNGVSHGQVNSNKVSRACVYGHKFVFISVSISTIAELET